MPAAPDARHAHFANFVKRAVDGARVQQGWTVAEVAEHAGISRSTLYRWLAGDWKEDPKGAEIAAFCDAVGIPPEVPFLILWPGKARRPIAPQPLPLDPDIELVMRRLRDPNVPETEKYHIRETIKGLALRKPGRSDEGRGRRRSTG